MTLALQATGITKRSPCVLHALYGTYDILSLVGLSSELGWRTVYVHLPRYLNENRKDWNSFEDSLFNFQLRLPLKAPPDLLQHSEYFYNQSLGCIGSLKDFLTKALSYAIDQDTPTLLSKHWEYFKRPNGNW
jgi:hypothetical protein